MIVKISTNQQEILTYPINSNSFSVLNQGHASMNQAPTSLNLLTNPASTDFSVSRIMLKPPNTGSPPFADFLAQDTGTNILSQVPYLQSGAKYVGLSRNDRFMIAATNDKLALF